MAVMLETHDSSCLLDWSLWSQVEDKKEENYKCRLSEHCERRLCGISLKVVYNTYNHACFHWSVFCLQCAGAYLERAVKVFSNRSAVVTDEDGKMWAVMGKVLLCEMSSILRISS